MTTASGISTCLWCKRTLRIWSSTSVKLYTRSHLEIQARKSLHTVSSSRLQFHQVHKNFRTNLLRNWKGYGRYWLGTEIVEHRETEQLRNHLDFLKVKRCVCSPRLPLLFDKGVWASYRLGRKLSRDHIQHSPKALRLTGCCEHGLEDKINVGDCRRSYVHTRISLYPTGQHSKPGPL